MTLSLTLGSSTLDLTSGGYHVTSLDPGFPVVRQVSSVRPDVNGTDDTTSLFGERLVSMTVLLNGNRQSLLDGLAPFLLPSARPILTVDSRRVRLRPAQRSVTLVAPAHVAEVQLQWVAPDGVWEAASESTVTINPSSGAGVGRSYPGTRDKSYVSAPPASSVTATNAGNAPVYPVVRIDGFIRNPRLFNVATQKTIRLATTVADDEFLEVDFRERTIRKNGSADLNYLSTLDWTVSSWSPLAAGSNLLILSGDEVDVASASAVVTFRSAFL